MLLFPPPPSSWKSSLWTLPWVTRSQTAPCPSQFQSSIAYAPLFSMFWSSATRARWQVLHDFVVPSHELSILVWATAVLFWNVLWCVGVRREPLFWRWTWCLEFFKILIIETMLRLVHRDVFWPWFIICVIVICFFNTIKEIIYWIISVLLTVEMANCSQASTHK